ncbi:MAG: hypothetical protein WA130_22020 [Candidatus Methanoperedens sp.]
MNSSERCKWEAIFNFPSNILEKSITATEGVDFKIEFNVEKVENGIIFKGFSIITPILTRQEAVNYVQEKANRIFDYMSAIHNRSIEGYLSNMISIKPKGEVRTGLKILTAEYVLHKPEDLDFNEEFIKNVLRNKNEKLMRQLSRCRRGLKTDDVITKIREFYQIIEDEYPLGHPFLKKYLYVRNLQSHPTLENPSSKTPAEERLEKNYIDPSNPKDMEAMKTDSKIIEIEAKRIIDSKLTKYISPTQSNVIKSIRTIEQ